MNAVRPACALCKSRSGCRLRQPGTWVVECDVFEADPAAFRGDLRLAPSVQVEQRSGRRPAVTGSCRVNG